MHRIWWIIGLFVGYYVWVAIGDHYYPNDPDEAARRKNRHHPVATAMRNSIKEILSRIPSLMKGLP